MSMRSAAGNGSLQALLASVEPISLTGDELVVRGQAYDVRLIEQRHAELATLATRARKRDTTLRAEPIVEAAPVRDPGEPALSPAEAAMQIPLVRETAELFQGTVVRALRRNDT